VFGLPRISAGGAPAFALVDIGNGDVAVAGLFGVAEPASGADDARAQALRTALATQHGAVELGRFQEALRDRADLEVKPLSTEPGRPLD
jgi:hypothetical protein